MKKLFSSLVIFILICLVLPAGAQQAPTKAEENGAGLMVGLAKKGFIKNN